VSFINGVRDPQLRVVDVVLASCAAPTFFAPYKAGLSIRVDGGLWANNPILVPIVEAIANGEHIGSLSVLSIGTGCCIRFPKGESIERRKGLVSWALPLVPFVLSLNSQAHLNIAHKLGVKVLRVDFLSPRSLPLDGVDSIDDLKRVAERLFVEHWPKLSEFFA